VFTVEELDLFLAEKASGKPNTRKALLTYYRKQGRIVPVRRGLYAVVPFGSSPDSSPVDPYLLAAKITKDAVLSYHTALEFHGKAYSLYTRLHYLPTISSLRVRVRLSNLKTPYCWNMPLRDILTLPASRGGLQARMTIY
jgi:predicted transcriptional regulator of viral defense system